MKKEELTQLFSDDNFVDEFMTLVDNLLDKYTKKGEEPQEVKRWRDNAEATINGYYIASDSFIDSEEDCFNIGDNYNVFATMKQAKSALAMARISQIMANDERFGGVITDEEWHDDSTWKYFIYRKGTAITSNATGMEWHFLAFHEEAQRDLFLEENEDLIKDYLMID